MRRGPGRPTATAAAASAQQQAAAVVPVDRRVPVFSLSCLAKLLDAIADDGFQLPEVGAVYCLCSLSSGLAKLLDAIANDGFQLPEVRVETGCWVGDAPANGSLHCWGWVECHASVCQTGQGHTARRTSAPTTGRPG